MKDIEIQAQIDPRDEDLKIIDEGIDRYNLEKIGEQKYISVGSFARKNGKMIGGICGNLFWNYLYIDMMWIEESHRKTGIGRQLIEAIEKLSIEHGIYRSHLCTASFQSVGFYEKCGYKIFGQLEDMPQGETEYYLYKRLSP